MDVEQFVNKPLPIWNDPEIPYFSGSEKEGSTTFDEFIRIFETETNLMGLNTSEQKAEFVEAYLTGTAYTFYQNLDFLDVNPKDWEAVKLCFLKFFQRRSTSSTIIVADQSQQVEGKEKPQTSKVSEGTEKQDDKFAKENLEEKKITQNQHNELGNRMHANKLR